MKTSGKCIGVEIGNDTLKLAVMQKGAVTQMVAEQLRHGSVLDGRIASVGDIAATIKETMKINKIHGTAGAVVLPAHCVIGRTVTMPQMEQKKILLNLPFEFKDLIGKESDKYYYDYIVKSTEGNAAELYACAVLKSDVDMYYDIFRRAGLRMKAIVPPEIAWLYMVRNAVGEPSDLCIVDIGHATTDLYIYADGNYVMGRTIGMGGRNIDTALSNNMEIDEFAARTRKENNAENCLAFECSTTVYSELALEITNTIKYYNEIHYEHPIEDIYFCGGTSNIAHLREAICRLSDVIPHHIARLVPGIETKNDVVASCAIAAGAAAGLQ